MGSWVQTPQSPPGKRGDASAQRRAEKEVFSTASQCRRLPWGRRSPSACLGHLPRCMPRPRPSARLPVLLHPMRRLPLRVCPWHVGALVTAVVCAHCVDGVQISVPGCPDLRLRDILTEQVFKLGLELQTNTRVSQQWKATDQQTNPDSQTTQSNTQLSSHPPSLPSSPRSSPHTHLNVTSRHHNLLSPRQCDKRSALTELTLSQTTASRRLPRDWQWAKPFHVLVVCSLPMDFSRARRATIEVQKSGSSRDGAA